jgi:putative hydrolase of the HAD superfamily
MVASTVTTLLFDMDNTLIDRNKAMIEYLLYWLRSAKNILDEQATKEISIIMQQDDWGYLNRMEFCSWLLNTYNCYTDKLEESRKIETEVFMKDMLKSIPSYIKPPVEVISMLKDLKKHFRLILATNGASETQRLKIVNASLDAVFEPEDIFVSGEVGYDKPAKEYYSFILNKLNSPPHQLMMVGDDPVNDIVGAAACGIQTCWVSQGRQYPSKLIPPEKTIETINEIERWTSILI